MGLAINFVNFLKSVHQNNHMLRTMIRRDIRGRYVGSVIGIFWSVVHPLTQIAIYYFVFSVILRVKLGPEYGDMGFALWMVTGLLPWLFFSEIIGRAPEAILEQSNLITNSIFPSEILPLAHLGSAIINHAIGLAIFAAFVLTSGESLTINVLLLMPALVAISILALGLSWLISSLNLFLRDIGQMVGVFINVWFFITPIIYPRNLIPDSLQTLYGFNPMLHFIEVYRSALLGRPQFVPEDFLLALLPSLCIFTIGGLIFKKLKPLFGDVL